MVTISGSLLLGYGLVLSVALVVLNKNGVSASWSAGVALGLCLVVAAILFPGFRLQWFLSAVVPTAAVFTIARLQTFQRHPWWLLFMGPMAFLVAVVLVIIAYNVTVGSRVAQ